MDDDTSSQAPGSDDPGSDQPGDAVQAGLEQFQRAALDAVRAARTMLEAAESVLQEPAAAKVIADTVTAFARTATETVAGFAAGTWPPERPGGGSDGDAGHDDGPDEGVERIPVD